MSTTIDQRVVEMRFDNKQFEANVATTMSTLEKLKSKLNFTNSAKGLEAISKAANKIDLSGLSAGIEIVHAKFSALEVIGVTALANITNSAVNAGKRMVNALTVEPVKTGFNEYELKLGSLQTIMASTGESIETVNKYLNELNEYSDKTIYSFSDMTQNIGKFTNAGVKLEDAVKAIQGVSNVAAISGANANEASRAMYNFAQALSAGSVKLIDWRSIENANMGTKAFKEELVATAVEMGTLIKVGNEYKSTTTDLNGKVSDLFTSTKGFTESLSHQWMTTDVLVKTLNRYADASTDIGGKAFAAAQDVKTFTQLLDTLKESAQSGWATTWELIFGNLEEAKVLWTGVNNAISPLINTMSDARNEMLAVWKSFGGRDSMIEAVANAFNALKTVLTGVTTAFRNVFPKMTGKQLALMTKRVAQVTKGFKEMAENHLSKVTKGFTALFKIVKAVTTVVGGAFTIALKAGVVILALVVRAAFDLMEGIGVVVDGIEKWLKQNDILSRGLKIIVTVISTVVKAVVNLATSIVSGIGTVIKIVTSLVKEFMNLAIVQTILNGFLNTIQTVATLIQYFFGGIILAVKELFTNLANLKNISFESVTKIFVDFGKKIKESFENVGELFDKIHDSVKSFGDTVKDSFDTTGKTVDGLQGKFVAFASVVRSCLYSIGPAEVFAVGFGIALIYFLRKFTLAVNKIIKPVTAFSGVLTNFGAVLNSVAWSIKASALTAAALAITMMAASLVVLTKTCTPEELAAPFVMLLVLSGALTLFAKVANSFGNVDKFVISILSMAGSIVVLTGAMKVLESIDMTKILKVGVALALLMAATAVMAIKMAEKAPVLSVNAAFLLAFSSSLLIMALSMDRIASIDEAKVSQAMANMMLIAGGLAAVSLAVSGLKMGSAAGILLIAGGIYALLEVVKIIGGFTADDAIMTIHTLLVVTVALLPLFLVTQLAGKYAAGAGVALIGMGIAFAAMTRTFKILAEIDPDMLTTVSGNLFMLMLGMAGLVAATKFAGEHAVKAGITLLQMAGAMIILTAAITLLSHIDAWGLVKATAVISGIMFMMKLIIESTEYARDCKATLIILGGVIGLIVASIGILAMIPAEDLALATVSILGVLGVFSVLVKALGTLNGITANLQMFKNILAGLVMLIGIFAVIGAFLFALQCFDVNPSIETVASISILMFSIAGVCAILSAIAPLAVVAKASLRAIITMLVVTAGVIGVVGFIAGAIGKILPEGTEASIQRGLDIIKMICFGIGEAIGSVIGGFGSGLFSGLESIGKSLTAFTKAIGGEDGFIEAVKKIDERAVEGAGRLCAILLKLGGTTFLNGLGGFNDSFQEIADSNIEGSLGAVEAIGRLGEITPKLQKLMDWINENDFSLFSRNTNLFGNSMKGFASAISGFPVDAVMAADAISQTLTSLQNGIRDNVLFSGDFSLDERGQELATFGTHLYAFYSKIRDIDAGQLTNVMTGLDTLTTSVKNLGTVDDGTLETFKSTFINMGNQAIAAFVETFKNAAPQVSQAVNGLLSTISASMSGNVPLIKAMGQTMISNLIIGMQEMKAKVVEATGNITRSGYFETTKFYDEFYQSGEYNIQGFVNGMRVKQKAAKKVAAMIAQSTLDAMDETLDINSPGREPWWRGEMSIEGFIGGFKSLAGDLKNTVVSGMEENVLNPMGDVQTKAKEVGTGILSGWTDSLMESIVGPAMDYVPELKTMFEDISVTASSITDIDDIVGGGTTSAVNELTSAMNAAGLSSGGLSRALGGTSSASNTLSKALGKSTKKKKVDINKTYEATTAVEKYMERLYKESDQYKTDTETLKQYRAELEELKKERDEAQKQLEDHTEGRIKLSKEETEEVKSNIEELEKSIESKSEDIADHLETMCDNAQTQYDDLRDAIKNTVKDTTDPLKLKTDVEIDWKQAFDDKPEFDEEGNPVIKTEEEPKYDISDNFFKNMRDQIKETKTWMEDLDRLASRGISTEFLNELRELGPSGAEYVRNFRAMSDQELKKVNQMFEQSGQLSAQMLLKNFESSLTTAKDWIANLQLLTTSGLDQRVVEAMGKMGTASAEYINAFLSMAPEEIAQFNEMYLESLTLPDTAADDLMSTFVDTGAEVADSLVSAINTNLGPESENAASLNENTVLVGENASTGVATGVENKKESLFQKVTSVASDTLDGFKKHLNRDNGKEISKNICNGLIAGIENGKSGVITAAVDAAVAAYKAAKDALDIESPSKKFFELGMWSDIGMANGFYAFGNKVADAAVSVGKDALGGMKDTLSHIGEAIDSKIDINPTIKPIVDLSNVEESASEINSLFSASQTSGLARANQNRINATIAARNLSLETKQAPVGGTSITFEQNNYSPKALSRIDIYRQTKNQFSAAKGVLSEL